MHLCALPKRPKTPNPFYELGSRSISVSFNPGLRTKEWSKNAVSLSCYFSFISTDRQTHLASGYWLLSYLYLFSFLQTEFCLQDICSKEIYCIYLKVRQVVEFLTCGYKNWLDCCKSICVKVIQPKKLPGSPQKGTKNFRAEIQK